jgi:serine protease AprX
MKKLFVFFGLIGVLMSFTLLDKEGINSLSIYPHPIVRKAKVSCDVELRRVEVYNLLGNKVMEKDGQGELDFTDLPSGYYLVKAYSEKGEIVKRVQKN